MPENGKISIQRRLIAVVVLSQLLLAIGLVGGSVYLNHRLLLRAFDNALQQRATSIAALVRYSEDLPVHLIFETSLVLPALEHNHPDIYQITGTDGRLIARSATWPGGPDLAQAPNGYSEFEFKSVRYRALRLQLPVVDREPDIHTNDVLMVTYASPTDAMHQQVLLAGVYTAAGTAVLLLLGIAFAVWGTRRGLQPLSELTEGAAQVSPANWELKASRSALETTELAPLARAMSTMLDVLHAAFEQQRDFVANAAHELKTPVAILKSTLQSLIQRPRTAEEYRLGLEQALNDLDRLEDLLHAMLRLARAEQSALGKREADVVDVGGSCESALDALAPLMNERGIRVSFSRHGALPVHADAADLRQVWCNLLENAVRYSPAGGRVAVRLQREHEWAMVEIEDEGPGISAADLPRIFDRFYRGDTSRSRHTGGYGLGLSISKALIELYSGSIAAERLSPHGTRMVVRVPLAESPLPQPAYANAVLRGS